MQALHRAIVDAVAEGGNRPCFIDLSNLSLAKETRIFEDRASDEGHTIIGTLARYINALPSDATPVIRYLIGNDTPIDWNGFVAEDTIYQAITTHIRHPRAMLYCGNSSPSVPLPTPKAGQVSPFIERVVSELWQHLTHPATLTAAAGLTAAARALITDMEAELRPMLPELLEHWVRVTGSWNHSKIFAMNGLALVTGGMNYWKLYQNRPDGTVLDLDISLRGDAAVDAHLFADYLWQRLGARSGSDPVSWCKAVKLDGTSAEPIPCRHVPVFGPMPVNAGPAHVLSVGRNGDWHMSHFEYPVQIFDALRDAFLNLAALWIEKKASAPGSALLVLLCRLLSDDSELFREVAHKFGINPMAWASRYSRSHAIRHAQRTVRMSQQAVVQGLLLGIPAYQSFVRLVNERLGVHWDGLIWAFDTFDAMGCALATMSRTDGSDRGIDIVCSFYDKGWSDMAHAEIFSSRLGAYMQGQALTGIIKPAAPVADLVRTLLRYRRVRNDLTSNGNHCKLTLVDDALCYIGSDNAYPSYNMEFGVWIDDRTAIREFVQGYWNGLQHYLDK
ncbi:hypothetical protein [Paludibacterium paludis]|uniref:hypothetical protein n=1 Tax=Paludibacterium paludis TaxID=1225769 RepID=UPI001673EC3C|nr:hypothetical protein [Paludibacterium paludis]